MRAGTPLTDDDRWPWLDRVANTLRDKALVIVGCSALRHAYRDRILRGAQGAVEFVHLVGDRELIATLEPPGPDEAIMVDIAAPLPALIDTILDRMGERHPGPKR